MYNYNPICRPNQVIKGTGQVAIVTGWTPKESVAKHLEEDEYAAIGKLYSPTRGISPLIRNLLANPHVRHLVLLNATKEDKNAKSISVLEDFFLNGFRSGKTDTGRDCWVIDSNNGDGYIDRDISPYAINVARLDTGVYLTNTIAECVEKVKELNNLRPFPSMSEPLIFPEAEPTTSVYPGARYGHRIEGKTIAETWVKLLHRIKTTGTVRPTHYDGQWQELIDLMAIVTDEPEGFYFPEPNYLPLTREFLESYIPQILDDAPYRPGVKYTYGQRMRSWFGNDQVEQVIQKLAKEPDAASGVISLWDAGSGNQDWWQMEDSPDDSAIARYGRNWGDSDHDHGGSPCLNHIWVRIVDGELSLTATFRSNDMANAWPSNAMGLRALQRHILDRIVATSDLHLRMGPLITISQSAHIYDDMWGFVDDLIANQYAAIAKSSTQEYFDRAGNFVVSHDTQEITVEWLTANSSEVVKTYKGSKALKLSLEITKDCPAISVENALYLGRKLQEAEFYLDIG
jgi:thymidylate synthase